MQDRAALMLGELGSAYPKIAGELAELIVTGNYYLAGGLSGRSSGNGNGCDTPSTPAAAITPGYAPGRSVTEGSVLEVRTPSKTQMRTVSRVLQNVVTLGGKASIPPRTDADGQPIDADDETDAGKAWRTYLLGRNK